MEQILELPFDIAHAGGAVFGRGHRFDRTRQVGGVDGANLAHGTVMDAFVELASGGGRIANRSLRPESGSSWLPPTIPGPNGRQGCRLPPAFHRTHAFRGDGGFQVLGAKSRRRSQEHNVNAALDEFLETVQPHKDVIRIHLHPAADFRIGFEAAEAVMALTLEYIGHGGEHDVRVGVQGLPGGSGSASSAADQTHLQGITVGGERLLGKARLAAKTPPTAAVVDVLIKSRREVADGMWFPVLIDIAMDRTIRGEPCP